MSQIKYNIDVTEVSKTKFLVLGWVFTTRLGGKIQIESNLSDKVKIDFLSRPDVAKVFSDNHLDENQLGFRIQGDHLNKNINIILSDGVNEEKIFIDVKKILLNNKKIACKRIFKSINKQTICKGLRFLKERGITATVNKIRQKAVGENNSRVIVRTKIDYNEQTLKLTEVNQLKKLNKRIAIHLHLFYEDLIPEFIEYINHMPYEYDLYISIINEEIKEKVENKFKNNLLKVSNITVKKVPNRGRDFASFVVEFNKDILKYDYVCHIHSKKSLYSGTEQSGWRKYLLDNLFGSEATIARIFNVMEENDEIGMVYPDTYSNISYWAHTWLCNKSKGMQLLNKLGIVIEKDDTYIEYSVGSMFWAKVSALIPLFDSGITLQDFEEENGQNDGTFAHAIERCLPIIVRSMDQDIAVIDVDNNILHKGKGYKNFQEYWNKDMQALFKKIDQADVVSFDIFDTLITRKTIDAKDIRKIIAKNINRSHGLNINFEEIREKAEYNVRAKEGFKVDCNLDQIYEQIGQMTLLSKEVLDMIKEMEIKLEIDLAVPRKEMVEAFYYAKDKNKVINLISDMYLTREAIIRILDKCGISGYNQLLVSCEVNKRKDTGEMWDYYLEKYINRNLLHIGDNEHSDIQMCVDRGIDTFHIINSKTLNEISGHIYDLEMETFTDGDAQLVGNVIAKTFNSPFKLNKYEGKYVIEDEVEFGYCIFGPVITHFMIWFIKQVKKNHINKVAFLAREGYVLEKVFKLFKEYIPEIEDVEGIYLMASRRSTSVASIKNEEDIKNLLDSYYTGKISDLLDIRYGIKMENEYENEYVELPRQKAEVWEKLSPYIQNILENSAKERESYLEYIEDIGISSEDRIGIVDLGYSGSIQYYLSCILEQVTSGYYFVTITNPKGAKYQGNTMSACYEQEDTTDWHKMKNYIHKYSLLLEGILTAPHGQVVKIENGRPIFNKRTSKEIREDDLENIHLGILEYVAEFLEANQENLLEYEFSNKLIENIIRIFVERSQYINPTVRQKIKVEDQYCGNQVIDVFSHYESII